MPAAAYWRLSVAFNGSLNLPGGLSRRSTTARRVTSTIPIVFSSSTDPVMAGLVPSLSRPGGNLTGVNYMQSELGAKRMGLLHEMVPLASRFTLAASSRPPPPSSAMNSRRLLSSIGDFLPYALRRRLARALSLPHLPSLPQGGLHVLGADLNCSESRRWPAPSIAFNQTRIAMASVLRL